MKAQKVLLIVGIALVAFFVITQPEWSTEFVTSILGTLEDGATAIINFVKNIFA